MSRIQQDVQAGKRSTSDLSSGAGFRHGYDQAAIRRYLRSLGARVAEVWPRQNGIVKLRHIWASLEQGWNVKVVIRIPGGGIHGYHAIIVEGLEVSRDGLTIRRVRVYDPIVGQVIRVPALTFKRLIAGDDPLDYGVLTLFRFNDEG